MTDAIKKIQQHIIDNALDAYIVLTSDDHGSEYIVEHFKTREFLCGFTGSAGTLVLTRDGSYLWTDGRYFIQAAEQLKGSGTELMKIGEKGCPGIYEFLSTLSSSPRIAFDFSTAMVGFVEGLRHAIANVELVDDGDIIDEVWQQRPAVVATKAYMLSDAVAGESIASKLCKLREDVKAQGCAYALVTSLDDIAWLFNLRGNDIEYNPVNYAYALVSQDSARLFIDASKLSKTISEKLCENGVEVLPYSDVYGCVRGISDKILIDKSKTSYALFACISDAKETDSFPTTLRKAVKNDVEIKNMRKAHIEDGITMLRFMRYLKSSREEMSELSLADKLESFRRESKSFIELSFDTICGYGSNGAIVHYSATDATNRLVERKGLLLVDSGAQYRYGTTDITRTYAMGRLTAEERRAYTIVLKSHIALARAVFPTGAPGAMLDAIARAPMYRHGMNFKHGTGHGVGYLLNVHEGPQTISPRAMSSRYGIVEGMITSNEPGYYKEGAFGIRHENLVLSVADKNNACGSFCRFETITLAPFDLDAIDSRLLDDEEKGWLNDYHALVYRRLKSRLSGADLKFLKKATRKI